MRKQINDIINRYKNTEIYEKLHKYYVYFPIGEKKYKEILNQIKNILKDYYLIKYKYKIYIDDSLQDNLLLYINQYNNLFKKTKFINDEVKIYPIACSEEDNKRIYYAYIDKIIDCIVDNNMEFSEVLKVYETRLKQMLDDLKNKIVNTKMKPYYGNPSYLIGRIRFVKECIDNIPDLNCNLGPILSNIEEFEKKYINELDKSGLMDDKFIPSDEFFADYDKLEKNYLVIKNIEDNLCPIVFKYWEDYLTNPNFHNDNKYRYMLHCFSGDLVAPDSMSKACCSLNTNKLVSTPFGDAGLIIDVNLSSVETMCSSDAGSWVCDKKRFVDMNCENRWQLTNPEGYNVWYECEKNSKLIMPNIMEKECLENNIIIDGDVEAKYYSEVFFNNNLKVIGVFYTDNCSRLDEITAYARKYNLPLINISLEKQRALNRAVELDNKIKL